MRSGLMKPSPRPQVRAEGTLTSVRTVQITDDPDNVLT
jgi:hypothetical protein